MNKTLRVIFHCLISFLASYLPITPLPSGCKEGDEIATWISTGFHVPTNLFPIQLPNINFRPKKNAGIYRKGFRTSDYLVLAPIATQFIVMTGTRNMGEERVTLSAVLERKNPHRHLILPNQGLVDGVPFPELNMALNSLIFLTSFLMVDIGFAEDIFTNTRKRGGHRNMKIIYSLRCISPRSFDYLIQIFSCCFLGSPENTRGYPVVVLTPRFCGIRGI